MRINFLGLTIGKREEKLGIRASSTCSIFLENVHVTKDNLLGKEGEGFRIAMSSIGEYWCAFSNPIQSVNH